MKFITYTDGGARGNPGPAGIGIVIQDEKGDVVYEKGKYIGEATNNVAEYTALYEAIKKAVALGAIELVCHLDSELAVKQLKGEYKVKNEELAKLYIKIFNLTRDLRKVEYKHVYREKNKQADSLVNQALDKQNQ